MTTSPKADPALLRDLFQNKRLLWQAFFGSYVVGLDKLLPVAMVSCLDDGSDHDLIADACSIEFHSVDAARGRRTNWIGSGITVVFEELAEQIHNRLRRYPKDSWLLTSSPPCPVMQRFCADRGYQYVGTPPAAIEPFKHKARLFEALDQLQLSRLAGAWLDLRNQSYTELASRFGSDLVVQQPLGAAGSATVRIKSQTDLDRMDDRFLAADAWVAPHAGELSFNINAAVIGDLVCVGFPSIQLAGCPELGAPWGGYCGNDYTAALESDPSTIADIQEQTERIGVWLRSQGYKGVYGLDFVLNPPDGRAYAVDLNPRWQGSTALSVQAELNAGRLPLMAALFAVQAGLLGSSDIRPIQDSFREPIKGSQMNLRCRSNTEAVVTAQISPGAYTHKPDLSHKRPAFRLSELEDGEVIVTGAIPREDVVIEPGAWLLRIVSWGRAVGTSSRELLPWASRTADTLHSALQSRPASNLVTDKTTEAEP